MEAEEGRRHTLPLAPRAGCSISVVPVAGGGAGAAPPANGWQASGLQELPGER
jgi:hypothetical protein